MRSTADLTVTQPVQPTTGEGAPSAISDLSERRLVQAMINGEDSAWREFYARYAGLMRGCITRVIGRSRAWSDDDIREVFALLLMQLIANDKHRLRMFDPERGSRFRSWIALLATHCARDFARTARRDLDRAPLSEAEGVVCDRPSPLDNVEKRERAELVASMLDAFPARDRELVSLYLGEELAPEEIAERMQISVKTVYSKAHKIKARLSAILSDARLAA